MARKHRREKFIMSRIRTIKPEFWTSEQIMNCSHHARLLFIGLWNFCDDHGVHPASIPRIKAEIFPNDYCTSDEIVTWINELIFNGLIAQYEDNGNSYWIVTGFHKHQRIDKPTYRHPLPPSMGRVIDHSSTGPELISSYSTNTPRVTEENSSTTQRLLSEHSTTECSGMERNGVEINTCDVETSPLSVSVILSNNAQDIFNYWKTVMEHPRASFDHKRERIILNALKLYTLEELKQAIDGCARTPYNMGINDQKRRYDNIDLIFRDADHIEGFIVRANDLTIDDNEIVSSRSTMAGVI